MALATLNYSVHPPALVPEMWRMVRQRAVQTPGLTVVVVETQTMAVRAVMVRRVVL
jgi:hypothetical protein